MKFWKTLLTNGCIFYTALTLFLLFANILLQESGRSAAVTVRQILLIFPCSLCFSAAGMLKKKISGIVGTLLHFLITIASLILFLYLPAEFRMSQSASFVLLVLVILFYWLLFVCIRLCKKKR